MNLYQSKHHLFVHIQQYQFAKCTNQTISACTLYITKLANSPNRASSPRISLLFCEQNLRITLTFTAFPYTIYMIKIICYNIDMEQPQTEPDPLGLGLLTVLGESDEN